MSTKKCDRCACIYSDATDNVINSVASLNVNKRGKHEVCRYYDLCPECSEDFVRWLLKGEKND